MMQSQVVLRVRNPLLLDVATYVSVAVMALLGISGLPTVQLQTIALALCVTFALLYRFLFRTNYFERRPSLYFGSQAVVMVLLFLLKSGASDAFNFLFYTLTIHAAVTLSLRPAIIWTGIYFGIATAAGNDYSDKDDMSDMALESRVRALSETKLDRPVGASFEYSNANYDILGLIVQTVSAQPYEAVVQQSIFAPLGMAHSFVYNNKELQHQSATGYRMWFGFPFPYPASAPRPHLPSGQQFSSAEDLAHLLIAHLNGGNYLDNSILSTAGIDAMQNTPVSSGADCATYSMHWSHSSRCDSSTLSLSGDTANFKARILIDKSEKLAVIVLMNAQAVGINGPRQDRIDDGVLDLLQGRNPISTTPHNVPILASMGLIVVITVAFTLNGIRFMNTSRKQLPSTKRQIILPLTFAILWLFLLVGMVNLAAGSLSDHPLAFMLENIPDLGWMIVLSAVVTAGFGMFRIAINLRTSRR